MSAFKRGTSLPEVLTLLQGQLLSVAMKWKVFCYRRCTKVRLSSMLSLLLSIGNMLHIILL